MFASTEEVETLNEEVQAPNEELETLNEEPQATVEELNTTNDDLQSRSVELQDLAVSLEAQRRASEVERERLAAILASMADPVLVVDATGTTVLTNAAYEATFGPGGERLVPLDADGQVFPPNQHPLRRAAAGESFTMEFRVGSGDEMQSWFEAHGQPLPAEGQPRGGVVAIRDITDRSLRRLQEEFIERASHELRTPLTGLQLYLEMVVRLLDQDRDDPRLTQYGNAALGQSRRLATRVNDLQDAARLRHGGIALKPEPTEITAVVQHAIDVVQLMAGTPNIELAEEAPGLRVNADDQRLEQVFLNLLNNAVTYAPRAERIDVRVRRQDAEAQVEVQDYGPGIPKAVVPQLFSRFYRGSTSGGSSGLGLGLFLAKEIVNAHGGSIDVRTSEGKGATFIVRLPLVD